MPVMNTSAPPSPTCRAAENTGVSMNRCRTHVMTPSSTRTTTIAIPKGKLKFLDNEWECRSASSWHRKRAQRCLPAHPDQEGVPAVLRGQGRRKYGAKVDTEPSISPAKPGCTICKTNSRRRALSSSSFTSGRSFASVSSGLDLRASVPPARDHPEAGVCRHPGHVLRLVHRTCEFRLQ